MQDGDLRKGPWLDEEDDQLGAAVAALGDRRWDALAKASGLRRSGKSCRLRWMNYLRPNLKHGNISADEERIIIELHEKWGNRWSKIARILPGRTDNEIKNYWRSYVKKKALVLDKECFISSTNLTSLTSECDATSPCSISDEWTFLIKDHVSSRPLDDSSDALDLLSLTQSPYETRLTEWMSSGPPDLCKMDPRDEFWDYDLYRPEWISGDCTTSLWDISLWDGE